MPGKFAMDKKKSEGDIPNFYEEVDPEHFMQENVCYGIGSSTKKSVPPSSSRKASMKFKCLCFLVGLNIVLAAVLFVCLAVVFAEISNVKASTASMALQFETEILSELQNATQQWTASAAFFHQQLSTVQNATDGLRDSFLQFSQFPPYTAASCASLPRTFPSGYYWSRTSSGSAVHVYCDMTRTCGGLTGRWMRLANLDMTIGSQQCPGGLQLNESAGMRTCSTTVLRGCTSVNYSITLQNIPYSRVCGRVSAYQVGTTNAFSDNVKSRGIEDTYVDGVSLTHGSPRQHIWTFAAGLGEDAPPESQNSICPCNSSAGVRGASPPEFVGEDYFCDTGVEEYNSSFASHFNGEHPLWDGGRCLGESSCCSFNNPPWFYKQLPAPTTDDIEMRLCRDEFNSNEDIAIEIVEIYVQ